MNKIIDYEIKELKSLKHKPKNIYYKGNLELLEKPKISIVGTRKPYLYTQTITTQLAQKLSIGGNCIVSGGAMGVDAIAHRAAGTNNTILVSPCGINHKYPAINKKLISQIEHEGLLISPFEEDFQVTNYSFVQF